MIRSKGSSLFTPVISHLSRKLSSESSDSARPLRKSWKDEADTVIIGGGVVGTSIAYYLARQGQKDVMLLEKSELTAGSTWHAAGLTTLYHPGVNLKNIHYQSINMFAQIEEETGQQVGFHRCGSMRLLTTPDRMDEAKYQMARQGWHKAPQKLVSPEEVAEIVPILNMEGVLGGVFNPYDGHIDPYSLTQAIAAGARKHGAEIFMPAPVTAMRLKEDGRWEVTTPHGTVTTQRVINASGFWGLEVGRLAGEELPLVPIHHQYLVTSSVPEVQALKKEIPVLRHLEGSFYLRMERDGLLIGPYESQEFMQLCDDWVKKGVPPGFGKELFEPDLDRLAPHLEVAMSAFPCFTNAEIQSVVCGPITYAPDLLPIVGPSHIPNLWNAVGFGYGIIHSGGVGKYLADWIQTGEPPFDLNECDPGRFMSHWADTNFALAKSRESYGMNNAVGYPHEERYAGRPTSRVSSTNKKMLERGAFMTFGNGWEKPAWFAKPGVPAEYKPSFRKTNYHAAVDAECDLIMNKVGVIDLSPFAKFMAEGPDVHKFLDFITANSLPKLHRTCISHCLTPKGKVWAELTMTAIEDGKYFIITGAGSELHDLRWLQNYAREGGYNVTFTNVTDDMGCLSIAGPNAKKVLEKLTSTDEVKKYPFLSYKKLDVGGVDCHAIRITYTGELGWEMYGDMEQMPKLYDAILEAGQEYGISDFGGYALNTCRIEKGFRMWGAEMNVDKGPMEAGLGMFINLKKDFLGKPSVVRDLQQGHSSILSMLSVDSQNVEPMGNESVWCAGKVIGNTTSGTFSHTTNQTLAFAWLPPFLTVPGTTVQVELVGDLYDAKVLAGPPLETQPTRERRARLKAKAAKS